ncbi:serine hydrolase [Streptococcus sp. DD13]|uniref:serine hydrolase n=1 Tax=Streptococcus sp. DD13 TaxID=1777881 RepID=UPI0007970FFE|nr:serine hydrolase [Streptococcus sp. DD13]KXT77551.1 D-alanyl-D-alanine carboxypeptidase [Streptococcus sp. DD13]
MKKMILFLFLLCTCAGVRVSATEVLFSSSSQQALAIEADTGQILYNKESDTKVAIGGLTKLLTAYLIYEDLSKHSLALNTQVKISDYPYYLTVHPNTTNVLLEKRLYTVDQLLNATLIASSDSAAIALAEQSAGSEKLFVDRMRDKLSSWGIQDPVLVNASGLSNSILGENRYPGSKEDDENRLSARDLAIIARHLYQDFPEALKTLEKQNISLDGHTYLSTNSLLKDFPHYRAGVQGAAVSYTKTGGASCIAFSSENDSPIISVLLHANDSDRDVNSRFTATNELLNYILNSYRRETIVAKGEAYHGSKASVLDGKEAHAVAVANQDLSYLLKTGEQVPTAHFAQAKSPSLEAPIKEGQELGTLTIDSNPASFIDKTSPSIKMIAKHSVSQVEFYHAWWNQFVRYVNEHL